MSTYARLFTLIGLVTVSLATPASADRLPRWMFWPKVAPVTSKGVEYRARNEIATDASGRVILRAWVEARDIESDKILWSAIAYEQAPAAIVASDREEDDPMTTIAPFLRGVLIQTKKGATLYREPMSGSTEWVADHRTQDLECPVHHRLLLDDLISIHYGLARPVGIALSDDPKAFPFANSYLHAGCCVMERKAAVRYCPGCRTAQAQAASKDGH